MRCGYVAVSLMLAVSLCSCDRRPSHPHTSPVDSHQQRTQTLERKKPSMAKSISGVWQLEDGSVSLKIDLAKGLITLVTTVPAMEVELKATVVDQARDHLVVQTVTRDELQHASTMKFRRTWIDDERFALEVLIGAAGYVSLSFVRNLK